MSSFGEAVLTVDALSHTQTTQNIVARPDQGRSIAFIDAFLKARESGQTSAYPNMNNFLTDPKQGYNKTPTIVKKTGDEIMLYKSKKDPCQEDFLPAFLRNSSICQILVTKCISAIVNTSKIYDVDDKQHNSRYAKLETQYIVGKLDAPTGFFLFFLAVLLPMVPTRHSDDVLLFLRTAMITHSLSQSERKGHTVGKSAVKIIKEFCCDWYSCSSRAYRAITLKYIPAVTAHFKEYETQYLTTKTKLLFEMRNIVTELSIEEIQKFADSVFDDTAKNDYAIFTIQTESFYPIPDGEQYVCRVGNVGIIVTETSVFLSKLSGATVNTLTKK